MLDFVSIGAQKTGTTWLHAALSTHPQIRFPAGKEVHFWDRHRQRGIDWYRAQFPDISPGRKNGDITPAYAILAPAVIREVREFNPALRIVYTIRNPIDRAWSAAIMVLMRGEMLLEEASDQWFIDHFRSRGSTMRGDYEMCLRNWRGVFPAEQLLVLRYESLCDDPSIYLKTCCRHIGVDPDPFDGDQPILRQRIYAGTGQPLRESLRPVLQDLYAEKIASLASYLGLDLSVWLQS